MKSLVTLLIALTVVSAAHSAPKLPAKKKSASVPTALPAYKGKKRVTVEFPASSETTGVVLIAEPTALDRAQVKEQRETVKVEAKPTPAVEVADATSAEPVVEPVAQATPAPEAPAVTPVTMTPVSKVEAPTSAPMTTAEAEVSPAQPRELETETATVSGTSTSITTTVSPKTEGHRSLFFETGLMNSRYEKLQSDLKNGASTMSLTLGIQVEKLEVRAALDVAHGLDQAVTPQNTRMLAARGGALGRLGTIGRLKISGGGTIGAAGIDVRSYRGVSTTGFTLKQHAMGTAMVIAPEIEARVDLGSQALARIALRYWHFAGAEDLTKLSALAGTAGIGYAF